jgi:hypothetical protein
MDLGEKDINALLEAASGSSEPGVLSLACGLLAGELGADPTVTRAPEATRPEELKLEGEE